MTICVACKKGGKVVVGSDSFVGSSDWACIYNGVEKIVELGNFMVAVAGTPMIAAALEEMRDDAVIRTINSKRDVRAFVGELFSLAKDLIEPGNLPVSEKEETLARGGLIIATSTTIYSVHPDMSVFECDRIAIGAGEYFAMGALEALSDSKFKCEDIVTMALTAACSLSPLCSLPLDIREVKHEY